MTVRTFVSFSVLWTLAGCAANHNGDSNVRIDSKAQHAQSVHWGYEGATGPDHWGDLSPAYVLAKTGKRQSPIDIRRTGSTDLPSIDFAYRSSPIHLVYNGHTIQQTQEKGSRIRIDGTEYDLKQLHFHAPSEHTVEGRYFDMEMHLVHKSADGDVAVVGVLIQEGKRNTGFDPMWDDLPDEESPLRKSAVTIDAASLLPQTQSYYRYTGSFTTPPCTEGVLWLVLSEPVEMSRSQINRFRAIIDGNNRPVQPPHGREVMSGK